MNATELDTLQKWLNGMQAELERLGEGVHPDPARSAIPDGTDSLEELGQSASYDYVGELETSPDEHIREQAQEVGRYHAKMEYLHELALAKCACAYWRTSTSRIKRFPATTRDDKGELGTILYNIVREWTDAYDAWKAYQAERQSVYSVEESAA